jgi:NADP-dependent 3-hydroxy acid dehydrogenase YdfG
MVPAFAKAGVKAIALVATNAEKLKAVEEGLNKTHPQVQTLSVTTDISSPESVAALFEKIKEKVGHADILINNAGVRSGSGNLHEVDPAEWWNNFVSCTLVCSLRWR